MTSVDTNVSNYTLSELMSIISVEDFDENEIIEKTNDLTNKFKHKNPRLAVFFQAIQSQLLQFSENLQYETDNTDSNDNDEWSNDVEKLLTIIHDKSIELSTVHKEKYIKLKRTADNFKIPIIVMSSIATFFNFGLQPYLSQQTIAIICSSLTFVVTMLGTIELYLQVNKHMELEFNISKDLYINAIDIYKILNLDKEHRPADPLHFLNERYDIFKQIIAKSDIMPDNILPVIIKSCKFRDIKLNLNKDVNSNI